MDRMELLKSLAQESSSKMVLLVMDGLGGLPNETGKTELESAFKPNLDRLAEKGEMGLMHMVDIGVTPGSGPGHLSLFGYDPLKFEIGRGILEAVGIGAEVLAGDVAVRGNFATWGDGDVILDRRAGRIPTEKNEQIIERLKQEITEAAGSKVRLYSGKEHRFVAVFSGEGLCDCVLDADPQQDGKNMEWAKASAECGEKMAATANVFIRKVHEVLSDEEKANGCLLRGFSGSPNIPSMKDLYGIRCAAIATYPMYKGLARLVGMDVLDAGTTLPDLFTTLERAWNDYDYFFIHVKYTDSRGEDGNFDAKVKVIEEVDTLIPQLTDMNPDVLVVSGDHSTPAMVKGHSWHPSPILLCSRFVRPDFSRAFGERECAAGSLSHFRGMELMGLMLAHGGRLKKFGA